MNKKTPKVHQPRRVTSRPSKILPPGPNQLHCLPIQQVQCQCQCRSYCRAPCPAMPFCCMIKMDCRSETATKMVTDTVCLAEKIERPPRVQWGSATRNHPGQIALLLHLFGEVRERNAAHADPFLDGSFKMGFTLPISGIGAYDMTRQHEQCGVMIDCIAKRSASANMTTRRFGSPTSSTGGGAGAAPEEELESLPGGEPLPPGGGGGGLSQSAIEGNGEPWHKTQEVLRA